MTVSSLNLNSFPLKQLITYYLNICRGKKSKKKKKKKQKKKKTPKNKNKDLPPNKTKTTKEQNKDNRKQKENKMKTKIEKVKLRTQTEKGDRANRLSDTLIFTQKCKDFLITRKHTDTNKHRPTHIHIYRHRQTEISIVLHTDNCHGIHKYIFGNGKK